MAQRTPLYKGLVRPVKVLGIPLNYFMIYLMVVPILFLWAGIVIAFIIGVPAFIYMWWLADKDDALLDVFLANRQHTPPTKNKDVHGGDSYSAEEYS